MADFPYSKEEAEERLRRYEFPILGNQSYPVFGAICRCAKIADLIRHGKQIEIDPYNPEGEDEICAALLYRFLAPIYEEGWEKLLDECRFLIWLYEPAPSFRELLLRLIKTPEFKEVFEKYLLLAQISIARQRGNWIKVCVLRRRWKRE